jgi:hypothetical protein
MLLPGWKFLFCESPIDTSLPQWPTSVGPMKIRTDFASLLKIVTPALKPVSQRGASESPEVVILLPFFETRWCPSYDWNLLVQLHQVPSVDKF